ncbi:unnamed protein product [Phytophthora lilii]|uniref:Unnamed protein product n=1 Tax=Phytophthora lilii TaxID=2077276 RepID=A0A9W6TVW8_9STRA|nr:unnamed protein product [Phytophthora lilii]
MGRPKWANTFTNLAVQHGLTPRGKSDCVNLAAMKLILGLNPAISDSYNKDTLFGVASMLCRLGVRLNSTSPFASRAIADFIAVLAYVSYDSEAYLTTGEVILDDALDTGGVGEMVARILLLAMDACVLKGRCFTDCIDAIGEFVSVESFLDVLGVDQMPIMSEGMTESNAKTKSTFSEWRSQWTDWHIGFTHFVQLILGPNEDTLWCLLGRQAAGIFPRGHDGAGLLIPMFWKQPSNVSSVATDEEEDEKTKEVKAKVSLMLVHVEENTTSTKTAMKRPQIADVNPLSLLPNRDVICMNMNVLQQEKHYASGAEEVNAMSL